MKFTEVQLSRSANLQHSPVQEEYRCWQSAAAWVCAYRAGDSKGEAELGADATAALLAALESDGAWSLPDRPHLGAGAIVNEVVLKRGAESRRFSFGFGPQPPDQLGPHDRVAAAIVRAVASSGAPDMLGPPAELRQRRGR